MAEKNVPMHIIKAVAGHSRVRATMGNVSMSTSAAKREVEKLKLPEKPTPPPSSEGERT